MQQDNRKKIGLFIIIFGLLILILIIYFGYFNNKKAPVIKIPTNNSIINNLPPSGTDTTASGTAETPRALVSYDLSKEAPHKVNATDVSKIAMAFAERFGSFSNQSSYGNFTDLKILMTANMQDWADKYVADLKASSLNKTSYYGITTNSLTYKIEKFDEIGAAAQIVVTTKRQENTESVTPSPAYIQKLDLDFKKVNGEWLVDKAYWEK